MPWKGEKDPYKIWLSEIILQQTRVEQGLSYYNRFIAAFPEINKLAKAPEKKVLKLWEGLGYYSRCRNLLTTAKFITQNLKGIFPDNYDDIKKLKGVGTYTAAAIASFAFNLPYAVVDGNVFRVLSRVYGIKTPIDTTEGKKYFLALADELLDKKQPGKYNQAIMDFGATVCKPVSPLCTSCVFQKYCVARNQHSITVLPVKIKKHAIKKRWFYYLVIKQDTRYAVQQRSTKDIWQGLYEFPLIEVKKETASEEIVKQAIKNGWLKKERNKKPVAIKTVTQQLSHQHITGCFITIEKGSKRTPGWKWVTETERKELAFPVLIKRYFEAISNEKV